MTARPLAALAALVLLAGCAGYQPGAAPAAPFRTVAVAPVRVEAIVPGLAPLLQRRLATVLDREPGLALAPAADADALVEVTVTEVRRTRRTDRADDTGLGSSYDVELLARLTVRPGPGAEPWIDGLEIVVSDPALVGTSFVDQQDRLAPVLADLLATRVRDAIAAAGR